MAQRPSDDFLRELLQDLEPRAYRGVKLSTELVVALVEEVLAHRARERELDRQVEEIAAEDLPPERRPTPRRPVRRRTSGPWAGGAELRPPDEPEELDLELPGDCA